MSISASIDPFITKAEQAIIHALNAWERSPSPQGKTHVEQAALRLLVGCEDFAQFRLRYRRLLRRHGGPAPKLSFAATR